MDILILKGPPNSGKTAVLKIVYNLLRGAQTGESNSDDVLGTINFKRKTISFFTNGNNSALIDNAVKEFKAQGVDILICACNKDILDSSIEFKNENYRVIIFDKEELSNCTNDEVAKTIIGTVNNSKEDFTINEFMKRIRDGVEETPLTNHGGLEFTSFLQSSLDNYNKFFKDKLQNYINQNFPSSLYRGGIGDSMGEFLEEFSKSILATIKLYYKGNIQKATQKLHKTLKDADKREFISYLKIPAQTNFYRTRKNEERHFLKEDLFHVSFDYRHIISTNRFSIIGFPALYLGDSTYVCWEEFGKSTFRNLWFSRLQNTDELNVIELLRKEDFIEQLNQKRGNHADKMAIMFRYLTLYPLNLACSVKTRFPNANFKAEYIIPQLLLEYVLGNKNVDGIKFPSTKVDYTKLIDVKAYNYVIPVKEISPSGHCELLKNKFHITEPTSLEIEELAECNLNNEMRTQGFNGNENSDVRKIELLNGRTFLYKKTAFGQIEKKLLSSQCNTSRLD